MEKPIDIQTARPVAGLVSAVLGLLAVAAGTLLAVVVLPTWLPDLVATVNGEAPKVFWYLSRGSALVAYLLLWGSMAAGLAISNRMARLWPGGPAAVDLHQYLSLLGLAFGLFHALILTGDEYIQINVLRALLPFAVQSYKPVWVGIGQISFYVWFMVVGSFYVRKRIGTKSWRWIHYASFLAFALALAHGLVSGTDSAHPAAAGLYWLSGGSVLFLLYYRILVTVGTRNSARKSQPAKGSGSG
jgi:predicted ferric reductase